MINIVRYEKNWEAQFSDIKYSDALEIAKDENIKEISIYQNLGLSAEDFSDVEEHIKLINVRAYDKNALINSNIQLLSGRLPENQNEIVISVNHNAKYPFRNLNDKLELTINGQKKEYTVVGIADSLEFDNISLRYSESGAITYLEQIDNNAIIDITVLTNNIYKIYETTRAISEKMNLFEEVENKQEITKDSETEMLNNILNGTPTKKTTSTPSIKYNTELLDYCCILEQGSGFARLLLIVGGIGIFIVAIASIIVIYTSFKMTYSERIKEFGMLSSIGMSKSQRRKMLIKEANLISIFSIPIGIILGLIVSKLIIALLDFVISKTLGYFYSFIILNTNVDLYMKVPLLILFLIIIIVYFIVFLSSLLPMRKINKISQIDAIKNLDNNKIKNKQVKTPKIIEKLFGEEGVLAYKNIRKEKSRYKTIVISLSISIVLFLCVSGAIANLYAGEKVSFNKYDDYIITIHHKKDLQGLIDYLESNNLINDYYISMPVLTATNSIKLENDMLTEGMSDIQEYLRQQDFSGVHPFTFTYSKKAYDDILKKAGISELKKDEAIMCDYISSKTKYGDKIKMSNLNVGDNVTLVGTSERTFRIAGIIEDFSPYLVMKEPEDPTICFLINEETYNETYEEHKSLTSLEIFLASMYIDTDKPYEIDEALKTIDEKQEKYFGSNRYAEQLSKKSQQAITKIVAYTFIGFIALISAINIFNTISFSVLLRKREFAMLKSIGMSNKKINKMMFLEGIFYGLDSIIYGILVSIVILYVMYLAMIETRIYLFNIPYLNIALSIIVSYATIFIAIASAKLRIKKQNIIDEIKNENI